MFVIRPQFRNSWSLPDDRAWTEAVLPRCCRIYDISIRCPVIGPYTDSCSAADAWQSITISHFRFFSEPGGKKIIAGIFIRLRQRGNRGHISVRGMRLIYHLLCLWSVLHSCDIVREEQLLTCQKEAIFHTLPLSYLSTLLHLSLFNPLGPPSSRLRRRAFDVTGCYYLTQLCRAPWAPCERQMLCSPFEE